MIKVTMPTINTTFPALLPVLTLHRDRHGLPKRVQLYRPFPIPEIIEYPPTPDRVRYTMDCWDNAMRRDVRGIPSEYGPSGNGTAYIVYLDTITPAQWCQLRDKLDALNAPPPVTVVAAEQESLL